MGEDHSETGPDAETAPGMDEDTLPAAADRGLADDDTQVVEGPPGGGPRPTRKTPHEDPTRIGRFVVIRRLGAGGMGVVYAAYDESLDRKVAVKLLRPDRAEGTDATSGRQRLLREAQALARLSHANVVQVYETGTFEDQVFVAMEFVEGETLKQWQVRPDREWREVVDKYLAAGRGLAAAHTAGIIHRDFKPDNVLVGEDDGVRVLDFGLARETGKDKGLEETPVESPITASSSQKAFATPLTQTGALMGTPAYMAPEQFHGHATDTRTDQFAFCVSLYEGVYGERPFVGKNLAELAHDVVTGEVVSPPQYTKVPPWLRKVLLRGLAVKPDERYADMSELLEALEGGLRRRSIRLGLGLGLAAVVTVGALGVMAQRGTDAAAFESERSVLESKFVRARALGEELGRVTGRSATVAEQWDRLVLAWARAHVEQDPTAAMGALANLRPEDESWGPAARMLAAASLERGVAWRTRKVHPDAQVLVSPDGARAIAVDPAGELRELDLEAGESRVLGPGVFPAPIALSYEGTHVAAVSAEGRLLAFVPERVEGPECRAKRLAWTPSAGELYAVCPDDVFVRWHPGEPQTSTRTRIEGIRDFWVWPDGESIAVLHADGKLRLRNPSRSDVRELADADSLGSLHGTPDGDAVVVHGRDTVRVSFSELTAEPWDAVKGAQSIVSHLGGGSMLSLDADGTVSVRDASGRAQRTLQAGASPVRRLGLARDGRLAVTVGEDGLARFWRLGSPTPARLGSHASPVVALSFASGGQNVASGTDNGTVWSWDVEGRRGKVLGQHASAVRLLQVSPDGRFVASASREPGTRLWEVATGELWRTVGAKTREGPGALAWSPQGHRLAVSSCAMDGTCPVLVHDVEADRGLELGSEKRAASFLRFSPDGSRLLSLHPSDDVSAPTHAMVWRTEDGSGNTLSVGRVGLPVTAAFAGEEQQVRIAFAGNDRTELRVLRFGADGGEGGVVFLQKGLQSIVADQNAPVLLLQDADGVLTTWDLRDDAVAVVGQLEEAVDGLVVAPHGEQLLITGSGSARIVEMETGEWRTLAQTPQVAAWGETLVAAAEDGTLRVWRDEAPRDPAAFLAWVRAQTDAQVELSALR